MPSGPRRLLPASTTSLPRPPGESDVTGDNAFISVSCFPTVKTKTKDPPNSRTYKDTQNYSRYLIVPFIV